MIFHALFESQLYRITIEEHTSLIAIENLPIEPRYIVLATITREAVNTSKMNIRDGYYIDHSGVRQEYSGYAVCSSQDDYDFDKGCRIALKRVLKPFSRNFRSLVWGGYFKASEEANEVHDLFGLDW